MHSLSYRLAAQQLRGIGPDARLIIVHPNYNDHHLIFSEILDDEQVVYVRLHGAQVTVAELIAQVDTVIALHSGPISYLVFDECDSVDDTVLYACVKHMLGQLSSQTHLVLLSRGLPVSILNDEALRAEVALVPVDEDLMLWDYAQRAPDSPTLVEVRALGSGRVMLNGHSIEDWDGALPRALFFYMVDRGMTTRNDIFQTFWPNLSVREATNVFHVTKRKINEVLGLDLTTYWSGFYHISPDIELSYDVVRFSELVQESSILPPEEAMKRLQQAVWLYRDDFLVSVDSPWSDNRRQELRQTYSEALISLAKLSEEHRDTQDYLGLYLQALRTSPQREDIVLAVMQAYHMLGRPDDALMVYYRLVDELQHNLGVSPARHLRELASELEHDTPR